jgi:hypothetical protein
MRRLPKTLEETYDRILFGIDEIHYESAIRILNFLAFAARPVKIEETAEILAIDLSSPPFYDQNRRLLDPRDVVGICSTLVTVSKDSSLDEPYNDPLYDEYFDFSSRTQFESIRLAHLSVKDYLLSERIKLGKTKIFSLDVRQSNSVVAQICLAYLMSPAFSVGYCSEEEIEDLLEDWPLFHYAVYFWPHHVKAAGDELDNETWDLLIKFFETKKDRNRGNFTTWAVALTPDIDYSSARKRNPYTTPLHLEYYH